MSNLKVVDLYNNTGGKTAQKFLDNTRSNLVVSTDVNKVEADFEWLDLMEDTIRYLDKDTNNELAPDDIITGKVNDTYKTERKDIDGYELIEAVGLEEGTMKAGDNVVTYYYSSQIWPYGIFY